VWLISVHFQCVLCVLCCCCVVYAQAESCSRCWQAKQTCNTRHASVHGCPAWHSWWLRDDNDFFFALPGSKGHLRFFDVMRRVAERAGLKRPDLLTCTRMRKHLATMAQVVIVSCHLHVTVVTFQWQTILLMLIGWFELYTRPVYHELQKSLSLSTCTQPIVVTDQLLLWTLLKW